MQAMQRCPFCGSVDLVVNPARGDTVCANPSCGEILQERAVVAETAFVQTASGGAVAAGRSVEWGGFAGIGQSSQELTIARGLTKLGFVADRLQLSAQVQEAGRRMYQLAVQMNFNVGRRTAFVASACLYVVCRRNLSPHMLIDFSDVLQQPVKVLGQVYIRLVRRLVGADPKCPHPLGEAIVEVPVVDPSIFIDRFSRKLDFGCHQRKVQNTAMRLIQFMHRDWICVGRRPNGLCGAALLVASFYHGFGFSAKDVAEVVRMQEGTIRRRLGEMRQTPLAGMSRGAIEKADAVQPNKPEDAPLPPCMQERRRREEIAALLDDQERKLAALRDREPPTAPGHAASLERPAMPPPPGPPSTKRARRSKGKEPGAADVGLAGGRTAEEEEAARSARFTAREPSSEDIESIARDIARQHDIEEIVERGTSGSAGIGGGSTWNAAASRIERLMAGKPAFDKEGSGEEASSGTPDTDAAASTPSCDARGESLSDVDDEELDMYLLDGDERQSKSDMWHEVNKDYLEEWHFRDLESRRRRQQDRPAPAGSGASQRGDSTSETGSSSGSGGRRRRHLPSAASCTQSAVMALTRKSKVGRTRINIEALESLFS